MTFNDKAIHLESLPVWRALIKATGRTLVVTNGCFDILHRGHVTYLEAARNLGDALLVGLNSDASVRNLKGPMRPINSEDDRASVMAALESVDAVCIFRETTAEKFLAIAQPDIYVKGGDYNIENINQEERRVVESYGGTIVFLPLVHGKSTTALIEKVLT